MELSVQEIPNETKWAMAAQGLTGALVAHLNALYDLLGKEKYREVVRQIWTPIGEGSAGQISSLGLKSGDAQSVALAGATMCMCSMGPEYNIEQVESSPDRTVLKVTQCPWNNRLKEAGISNDIMTACDAAFWNRFVKALKPDVTMRHGKKMHLGDPYCEYIFETKK